MLTAVISAEVAPSDPVVARAIASLRGAALGQAVVAGSSLLEAVLVDLSPQEVEADRAAVPVQGAAEVGRAEVVTTGGTAGKRALFGLDIVALEGGDRVLPPIS
jgi:hypothetical protein